MATQLSTTTRDAFAATYIAAFPAGSSLAIRTGAPAGVANPAGGTALVTITLPSTPLVNASGQISLSGTWSANASATGIAGHYRLTIGANIEEGTCNMPVTLTTSASTAANGNVLTFAATAGFTVGMLMSGPGILPDTFALDVTGTTVVLSRASTAGVGSGVAITGTGDLSLVNTSIASGQAVTVAAWNRTMPQP